MGADATPAIELENLAAGYDRVPVFSDVTGCFQPGSLTAIVGPNGGGKTTLARAIAGVLPPLAGRVRFSGQRRAGQVGYLAQRVDLAREFPISVFDVVALGLWRDIGGFAGVTGLYRDRVEAALEQVGLADLAGREIAALSGGQFQRVLFARLIAQDAPVILLDEPFSAVDRETTSRLIELVAAWYGAGRTVIVVLHDVGMVRAFFPETLIMRGRLVAWGPTEEVLADQDHASVEHGVDADLMRELSTALAGGKGGH